MDRYFYQIPFTDYKFTNKETNAQNHIKYMLARTQSMFEYKNLPESIPARMLELYLQINGFVGLAPVNGTVYAFFGALGGEPDEYYRPTIFTVANPALVYSKNLKIDDECIIIKNDSLYMGLMPLFSRYAVAMVENELSMNIATINSRIINLISAPDDRTKASAEKYLSDIEKGKPGVIAENAFLDGIRSQPYGNASNTQSVKNLIEYEQYLKASWYNEIGLNSNYNMKRETLTDSENQMNSDALLPLVDDMLKCRKDGIEKVNDMFGFNISVELNSAWEDNALELELEHEQMGAEDEGKEVKEDEETQVE